jgi:hypothetical protein
MCGVFSQIDQIFAPPSLTTDIDRPGMLPLAELVAVVLDKVATSPEAPAMMTENSSSPDRERAGVLINGKGIGRVRPGSQNRCSPGGR